MRPETPARWRRGFRLYRRRTGARVEPWGETAGGVLEGYVFDALEVAEFDRLAVDGALYEVRRVLNWPSHRQLMIQRVKGEMGE